MYVKKFVWNVSYILFSTTMSEFTVLLDEMVT